MHTCQHKNTTFIHFDNECIEECLCCGYSRSHWEQGESPWLMVDINEAIEATKSVLDDPEFTAYWDRQLEKNQHLYDELEIIILKDIAREAWSAAKKSSTVVAMGGHGISVAHCNQPILLIEDKCGDISQELGDRLREKYPDANLIKVTPDMIMALNPELDPKLKPMELQITRRQFKPTIYNPMAKTMHRKQLKQTWRQQEKFRRKQKF